VADATYAEVVHQLTADPAIVETKMMGMPSLAEAVKRYATSGGA
jgi:hypothetical protein